MLILSLILGLVPVEAAGSIAFPQATAIPSVPAPALPRAEAVVCVIAIVAGGASELTETAFGELLSHTGTDPQPYSFAGEPLDPNSGFQYHRARWMDPRVGRFASIDPLPGSIFEPPSLHRYLYGAADPVNKVDPSGEITLSLQLAVTFIIPVVAGIGISAAIYCSTQFAVSTTLDAAGVDTSGASGPCVNRGRQNQMRVQLQRGFDHFADDDGMRAPADPGVSARQLEAGLVRLFYKGKALIPSRVESDFLKAIVQAGVWGRSRVPFGVFGPRKTVHQEYFPDPRIGPYRVDVENLKGHNLRVF